MVKLRLNLIQINRWLILISLILWATCAFSQSSSIVSGHVIDSQSKKPVAMATVALFRARDTSFISYRITGSTGEFKIPGIPKGEILRLIITFIGYRVERRTFELKESNSSIVLDSVFLSPTLNGLEEVFVRAEIPPVLIRKDTIEFNASSFKTLPSALVEDLLRKLPGLSIGENGNISVNGRQVSRIYIDGKAFFGDDPKMATRNLPANIIDKVQVANDGDALTLNPDLVNSAITQIINLKLKRSIKKGWFGKGSIGLGSKKRYEMSGIMNAFKDTIQLSILGFANNINKAAFGYGDLQSLGGFRRSGNAIQVSEDGAIKNNNISFGGIGSGVLTSSGGGINFNHDPSKKLAINFQYFYGKTNNEIDEANLRTQYNIDTVFNLFRKRFSQLSAQSHRISGSVKWKIDKNIRIEFKPSLFFTGLFDESLNYYKTTDNFRTQINSSVNTSTASGNELSYNHSLLFVKTFKQRNPSAKCI